MSDKKDPGQISIILFVLIIVSALLYIHVQLRDQASLDNPVVESTIKPFTDLFTWTVTPTVTTRPVETPGTPTPPTSTLAPKSAIVPYVTPTLEWPARSLFW